MRAMQRTVAAVVAALVVVSAALGGASYLWCVPMARAQAHCCCHPTPRQREVPLVTTECCESHRNSMLPVASSVAAAPIGLPAVVALVVPLPRPIVRGALTVGAASRTLREARAGPSERRHAIHSVFLI